jgi:hypothetical protein
MQNYAIAVLHFDKEKFARQFAAFLADHALKGVHFAEISEIPQYQVSRILCGRLKTFGEDHQKICRYMQIDEHAFFGGDERDLAAAIAKFCSIGTRRARALARAVSDLARLPED